MYSMCRRKRGRKEVKERDRREGERDKGEI